MEKVDVAIVGAGLGGLTAAMYLQRAGKGIQLFEQGARTGGLLNSFERDGFVFDTGARAIENAGIITPLLRELGLELDLVKSDVTIGIGNDLIALRSADGVTDYKKLLASLFPEHVGELDRIFRVIAHVFRDMDIIYGFDNPMFRDFRKDYAYIFRELLPWFRKFLPAVSRMNRMQQPIEEFLGKITENRALKDMIDQHFFRGTPTFFALGYFYVYLDYIYPLGGTGRFRQVLTERILESGGRIALNTRIDNVIPAESIIVDSDGKRYAYDKLIWCADMKQLYRYLDPAGLSEKTIASINTQRSKLDRTRGGDSVFTLYLGVDIPVSYFTAITESGHLFYTPSREGLGQIHREELQRMLGSLGESSRDDVWRWMQEFCRLNTYEISIPAIRDPGLAPEGKTGLIISMLLEYDLVHCIQAAGWYGEFKSRMETCIIDVLEASIYPGLKKQITLQFSSTPVSIRREFGTSEGGITGWALDKPSPVTSNLMKMPKAVVSPIPGIWLAGQWAFSPAGIPTAILTGKYAAEDIIRKMKN